MSKPILIERLEKKANLESPIFTGIPQAPTATVGTSSKQIATTEFVLNNSSTINALNQLDQKLFLLGAVSQTENAQTYTNENIVGEKIRAIGYSTITKDIGNLVFLYFVRRIGGSISSIRISNTDDLYDIFGDEVVNKIYDYIISN